MKKVIVLLFAILPMFLHAGVIVKKSGENLDGVSIISVTDSEIKYTTSSGEEATILKSEVSAILYDDGRYEEIKQSTSLSNQAQPVYYQNGEDEGKEQALNVLAFGNYTMKIYKPDHEFDGATVEYRAIYKNQKAEPEWTYLGTAPFCYMTTSSTKNPFLGKEAQALAENRPLYIDNWKNVKKVEFRLSKEGYETVVVSPLVQIDFTGLFYFISLNKLKPLKSDAKAGAVVAASAVETAEASAEAEKPETPKKQPAKKMQKVSESKNTPVAEQKPVDERVIPQGCLKEGKKVYDNAFEEASARAMQQGYSKSQAKTIAEEVALKEKEKAINECYHQIVELDKEYDFKNSQAMVEIDASYSEVMASAAIKEMIPKACDDYAKEAYDNAYKDALAKAKRQGYSKSQADKIADEAAQIEKKKAVDECYNRIVIVGEDFSTNNNKGTSSKKNKAKGKTYSQVDEQYLIKKISYKEYQIGETTLDKKAYETFIRENCPEAWKKHCQSNQIIISGWTFFSAGIAMTSMWGLLGVQEWVPYQEYDYYYEVWRTTGGYYRTSEDAEIAGIVLGSLGAAFTVLSVPLLSAGYAKKYNTYKVYNKQCASQKHTPVTLNFKADRNGIGLALLF